MIKIFLTISFVMCLVLVSCDADIMSSNSVVEDEDDLKPACITGTYIGGIEKSKTYKVVLSKDLEEKYSLDFCIGDEKPIIFTGRNLGIKEEEKVFIFKTGKFRYNLLFGIDKNAPTLSNNGVVIVILTKQP